VRKKYRTVRFLKSNDGTDNGTKKVPRDKSTAVLPNSAF